jgi:hypothetical protein
MASPIRTLRPCRLIAGPWELINTVDMKRGEPQRIGVSTDKVLDAIEAGQVHLTEAEIKVTVTRMTRND